MSNKDQFDKNMQELIGSTEQMPKLNADKKAQILEGLLASTDTAANKNIFVYNWRKLLTAAVIFIAITAAIIVVNNAGKKPDQIVDPKPVVPTQQITPPVIEDETPDSGQVFLAGQLKQIDAMFAAGDTAGLIAMLTDGEYESKIAAANYLANLGGESAIESLTKLAETWQGAQEDNPFITAINKITERAKAELQVKKTEPQTPAVAVDNTPGITIKLREKESGKPVAGASLRINGMACKTDSNGDYRFKFNDLPGQVDVITAAKGYVPMRYIFRDTETLGLPDEYTIELEPAIIIGGTVVNEQGEPIEGVKLDMYISTGQTPGYPHVPWVYVRDHIVTTDDNGKWQTDVTPASLTHLYMKLSHPDYAKDQSSRSFREEHLEKPLKDKTSVMVLSKGNLVHGYVVDTDGNAIPKVSVRISEDIWGSTYPETVTDENGYFEFPNQKTDRITITAQANGYAPQLTYYDITSEMEPIIFELTPPNAMYGQVVDVDGNPIKGLSVVADTWRGERTLKFRTKTDADGRFAWTNAPVEKVEMNLGKRGYLSSNGLYLTASDEEQLVTMYYPVKITGKVTDAETGELISNFRATKGINWSAVHWQDGIGSYKDFVDGQYEMVFGHQYPGHLIRIDAEGYQSAVSRVFENHEGNVTYNFELVSGEGPSGIVYDPNGVPVVGAEIYCHVIGEHLWLYNGSPSDRGNTRPPRTQTDSNGEFSFKPQTAEYVFLVFHDKGFAEVTEAVFAENNKITLTSWARAEGYVYFGNKAVAGQDVNIRYTSDNNQQGMQTFHGINYYSQRYYTKTDKNGKYVFDRVYPEEFKISHKRNQVFTLEPGQSIEIDFHAVGRPVTGCVVGPAGSIAPAQWALSSSYIQSDYPAIDEDDLPWPDDFDSMNLTETMQWFGEFQKSDEAMQWQKMMMAKYGDSKHHSIRLDDEGCFKIDQVTPGTYTLTLQAYEKTGKYPRMDQNKPIGEVMYKFVVPDTGEVYSEEPFDIGTLELKLNKPLEIGMAAPGFNLPTLNGGTVNLTDFNGKSVLIMFWTINDEGLGKTFEKLAKLKTDSNFAMLSITMVGPAEMLRPLVEKAVKEFKITFPLGLLAGHRSALQKAYQIKGSPWFVLINPDGTVAGAGKDLDELPARSK